jgi:hypothetical protein
MGVIQDGASIHTAVSTLVYLNDMFWQAEAVTLRALKMIKAASTIPRKSDIEAIKAVGQNGKSILETCADLLHDFYFLIDHLKQRVLDRGLRIVQFFGRNKLVPISQVHF